ncbi:diguanylate cyclase, partial [Aduncisulcus paluster]
IEELKRDKRIKDLALIMLDVDRFKYINDHYGHNIGDIVLVEVAEILSSAARGSDFVVRYGGDEFLIVLLDSDEEAIASYVDRINKELERWNKSTEILDHDMEFSIGFDVYSGGKHIMD